MVTTALIKELRELTGAGMLDCKKALTETNGDVEAAATWLREKGIAKAAKKQSRIAAEGLCNIVVSGNTALLYELNSETDFVSKNDKFLTLLEDLGNALMANNVTNDEDALNSDFGGKAVSEKLAEATATIGEKITLRRVQQVVKEDNQVFGVYKHMGGRIVVLTVLNGESEVVAKDVAMHVAAINPQFLSQKDIDAEFIAKEKEILTQEALNEGKPAEIVEKMVMGRLNKTFKEICLLSQPFVKDPDINVEKYVKANNSEVVSFIRYAVGEGIEKKEVDFAKEVAEQLGK